MSAETLRRAAALMRERAEAASPVAPVTGPIPWHTAADLSTADSIFQHGLDETDAEHIASWHPAVALAVADWLARTADLWEYGDVGRIQWDHAVAVARVYLGEFPNREEKP